MSRLHYNRIDRYILLKYIKTFLLAMALIIVIIITFDLSEKLDDFLSHHAPLDKIVFQYYLNFLPGFVNLFSPLFVFISVIFFTSKMATNTEVIAILGAGISYKRMLRPYMHGSLVVAALVLVLGNFVIPVSNRTLFDFEEHYVKKRATNYYSDIHFQADSHTLVYADSYDVRQHRGHKVRIESFDDYGHLLQRQTADIITFDTTRQLWQCSNYANRTIGADGVESLSFKAYAEQHLGLTDADFDIKAQRIETMTTPRLWQHIARERQRGTGLVKEAEIELYQRLMTPLAIIIMSIIGVAVASRKTRGGMGMHLAVGITLAFAYIFFMKITSTFAINGNLSPFMAVLLPQLVFAVAAYVLVKKAPK